MIWPGEVGNEAAEIATHGGAAAVATCRLGASRSLHSAFYPLLHRTIARLTLSTPPCSCEDSEVPARGRAVVMTGLQIACPPGTYARVAPRSGLAVKHFIDTGAGVVDEDYRGEVGVVLFNHADTPFQGEATGDRRRQVATARLDSTCAWVGVRQKHGQWVGALPHL